MIIDTSRGDEEMMASEQEYGRYVVQIKTDPEDVNSWEDCEGLAFEFRAKDEHSRQCAYVAGASCATHLQYMSNIPHYVVLRMGLEG